MSSIAGTGPSRVWPELRVADWIATRDTLHLWTQVVGKVRIAFARDTVHASYDAGAVNRYWNQLVQADRVMNDFRARYGGKVSPVHFFWGSMDLACSRFSGRPAPTHPGGAPNCADWVMVEGYSHEVSSCGFWAGGGDEGAFYAYAYPEPEGFGQYAISPPGTYDSEGRLYVLPYESVRTADNPDAVVAKFLQGTYEAAAERAHWDRAALEVDPDRWKFVARYARHG